MVIKHHAINTHNIYIYPRKKNVSNIVVATNETKHHFILYNKFRKKRTNETKR